MKNTIGKFKILFLGSNHSVIFQRWIEWFLEKEDCEVGIIGKIQNYQKKGVFYDIAFPKDNYSQRTSLVGYIYQLLKVRKATKNFRPDIIHSHQSFLYGIFVSILNLHPHVITLWGSDVLIWTKKSKLIYLLTKFALKNCDLITAESQLIVDRCVAMGIDKKKIKKIQFGIDKSQFELAHNVKLDTEIKNKNVIIFPRGLDPLYNVSLFIESIPKVLEKFPDALFVIKYYNNKDNLKRVEEVKLKLKALKINESNYLFIGGLEYLQLIKLYSISSVFVSIPSSDSISISLIEGMIMGSVPVVSDIPANREIVDGTNGILVSLNSNSLAKAIIEILSNHSVWKENLRNNKKSLLYKFDQDRNMKLMLKLYRELIYKSPNANIYRTM